MTQDDESSNCDDTFENVADAAAKVISHANSEERDIILLLNKGRGIEDKKNEDSNREVIEACKNELQKD